MINGLKVTYHFDPDDLPTKKVRGTVLTEWITLQTYHIRLYDLLMTKISRTGHLSDRISIYVIGLVIVYHLATDDLPTRRLNCCTRID